MHNKTLLTLNKVIIKCTVHFTEHVQCTLCLVRMQVRDSDVLAWVWGQRKMSQVLGAFELLDVLRPVLALRAFWNYKPYFFSFPISISGRGKPRILNQWIGGTTVYSRSRLYLHKWDWMFCVAMRVSFVTGEYNLMLTSEILAFWHRNLAFKF
jgi:hypothetical protein